MSLPFTVHGNTIICTLHWTRARRKYAAMIVNIAVWYPVPPMSPYVPSCDYCCELAPQAAHYLNNNLEGVKQCNSPISLPYYSLPLSHLYIGLVLEPSEGLRQF